jgi:ribosome-associated translation inhibitor RaiA
MRLASIGLIFVFGAMFSGCGEAPTGDLDAAKAALAEAKAAEADRYASDEYNTASNALTEAETELTKQNAKFAMMRNYQQSKQLINSAMTAAQTAKDAAAANKERVRAEAEKAVADAQTAVTEVKTMIASAPKDRELKTSLATIQNELSMTEAALADVTMTVSSGDYLKAREQATTTLASVNAIKDELQQTIAKHNEAKAAKSQRKKT